MAEATAATAEEIQRQMREVRTELRDDVREIVENARIMADWQYYVRTYPWLCLGLAAAAGFLIVPPRVHVVKPDPHELADLVRQHQVAVKAELKPRASGGFLGSLLNMAAGAALQGAMAVGSYQLDQFLKGLKTADSQTSGGSPHEEPHH